MSVLESVLESGSGMLPSATGSPHRGNESAESMNSRGTRGASESNDGIKKNLRQVFKRKSKTILSIAAIEGGRPMSMHEYKGAPTYDGGDYNDAGSTASSESDDNDVV